MPSRRFEYPRDPEPHPDDHPSHTAQRLRLRRLHDACTGPACALTMDGPKRVTVNFIRFAELPYKKSQQTRSSLSREIQLVRGAR